MSTWIVIVGAALCTYALRASAVVVLDRRPLPAAAVSRMRVVAPAVLGAVLVSAMISSAGRVHVPSLGDTLGVLAGIAVVLRTGRAAHALLVGLPIAWIIGSAVR